VRFVIVLAVTALAAGIVVSVAAALRFSDAPCIESGGGGVRVCPSGLVGSPYSVQLQGDGGCGPALPYQYRVLSGSLPAGLSLSSSGLISGTPNGAGTANFYIELSDENPPSQSWCNPPKTAEREFSITINPGFRIDNAVTSKYWTLSESKSDQLTATVLTSTTGGQPAPNATWSVISGALPSGVTLSATGLLSGAPTAEGLYTFKVKAVDGGKTDDETFTIDVKRAVTITTTPTQAPKSEVGVPFELALKAAGGDTTAPYTWAVNGSLPTGVTFDTGDSTLSGTPSVAGVYTFTATATDARGRVGTYQGRIVVAAKLALVAPRAKPAKVDKLFRLKLRTTGGVVPVKWKLKKGPLPKGIKFDKTLGLFSGKPTKAGRYRITVEATDALKVKSTTSFTIVVVDARKR
jgi:large repetitive protein